MVITKKYYLSLRVTTLLITQQPKTVSGLSSGVKLNLLPLVFLAFPITALVTISLKLDKFITP